MKNTDKRIQKEKEERAAYAAYIDTLKDIKNYIVEKGIHVSSDKDEFVWNMGSIFASFARDKHLHKKNDSIYNSEWDVQFPPDIVSSVRECAAKLEKEGRANLQAKIGTLPSSPLLFSSAVDFDDPRVGKKYNVMSRDYSNQEVTRSGIVLAVTDGELSFFGEEKRSKGVIFSFDDKKGPGIGQALPLTNLIEIAEPNIKKRHDDKDSAIPSPSLGVKVR